MVDFVDELREQLEKSQEEEILSTIVMILQFYTYKYNRDLNSTITLIKKGYKKQGIRGIIIVDYQEQNIRFVDYDGDYLTIDKLDC